MLRTRITDLFGIQYPIVSAPMAMHSGATLAAAVSVAGGLGTFGGIHPGGPDWVREQIRQVRSQTERTFGVGFITAFIPMFEGNFQAVLEEKVPVVALSFGSPEPWLAKAKEAGATVICQVQTMAGAREAVDTGADVLAVQGNEAGGHTGTMNLLPFLARVLDLFPDVPAIAAGGVASARALAAVLAEGADGAWLGTALLATPEAVEITEDFKERIVRSDGEDTVFTQVFDIVDDAPWPQGIGGRVQRNHFVDEWHGREDEVRRRREELAPLLQEANERRDLNVAPAHMGQSAASVAAVRPAAEVVRSICEEAERLLRQRSNGLVE